MRRDRVRLARAGLPLPIGPLPDAATYGELNERDCRHRIGHRTITRAAPPQPDGCGHSKDRHDNEEHALLLLGRKGLEKDCVIDTCRGASFGRWFRTVSHLTLAMETAWADKTRGGTSNAREDSSGQTRRLQPQAQSFAVAPEESRHRAQQKNREDARKGRAPRENNGEPRTLHRSIRARFQRDRALFLRGAFGATRKKSA